MSLDVLKNPSLGTLNTPLNLVTLDFLGFAQIVPMSYWEPQINKQLGVRDKVIFEDVRLGGSVSPSFEGASALTGGDSFEIITANSIEGSFGYLDNSVIDDTPGSGLVSFLSYDNTIGSSSVVVDILAVQQDSLSNSSNPVYNGTVGFDVTLGDTSTFTSGNVYQNISTGDIVIDQGGTNEVFEALNLDFARLAGSADGTNILKLVNPGFFDFIQLPGTAVENFSVIDLSSPGVQIITLDDQAIAGVIDQVGPALTITGPVTPETDRVVLFGDFFEAPDSPANFTNFSSLLTKISVSASVQIEIHRSDNTSKYQGTDIPEFISGTQGDDFIDAKGGNDSISALDGNDTIVYDINDTGVIDAGFGLDTLLIDNGTLDLSLVNNLLKFEKIELIEGTSDINLNFADLFDVTDPNRFLDSNQIDTFSNNPVFGDHQLLIEGTSAGSTLRIEGVSIDGGNGSLFTELSSAGITVGPNIEIAGKQVMSLTLGDVTIFLTQDLFELLSTAPVI